MIAQAAGALAWGARAVGSHAVRPPPFSRLPRRQAHPVGEGTASWAATGTRAPRMGCELTSPLRGIGGPLCQQERGVIAQATGLVIEHRSHQAPQYFF